MLNTRPSALAILGARRDDLATAAWKPQTHRVFGWLCHRSQLSLSLYRWPSILPRVGSTAAWIRTDAAVADELASPITTLCQTVFATCKVREKRTSDFPIPLSGWLASFASSDKHPMGQPLPGSVGNRMQTLKGGFPRIRCFVNAWLWQNDRPGSRQ